MKGALPPQPELFGHGAGGSPGIPATLFLLLPLRAQAHRPCPAALPEQ